jgi:hypothetical protein
MASEPRVSEGNGLRVTRDAGIVETLQQLSLGSVPWDNVVARCYQIRTLEDLLCGTITGSAADLWLMTDEHKAFCELVMTTKTGTVLDERFASRYQTPLRSEFRHVFAQSLDDNSQAVEFLLLLYLCRHQLAGQTVPELKRLIETYKALQAVPATVYELLGQRYQQLADRYGN